MLILQDTEAQARHPGSSSLGVSTADEAYREGDVDLEMGCITRLAALKCICLAYSELESTKSRFTPGLATQHIELVHG